MGVSPRFEMENNKREVESASASPFIGGHRALRGEKMLANGAAGAHPILCNTLIYLVLASPVSTHGLVWTSWVFRPRVGAFTQHQGTEYRWCFVDWHMTHTD